jgi:hypothetical protein
VVVIGKVTRLFESGNSSVKMMCANIYVGGRNKVFKSRHYTGQAFIIIFESFTWYNSGSGELVKGQAISVLDILIRQLQFL